MNVGKDIKNYLKNTDFHSILEHLSIFIESNIWINTDYSKVKNKFERLKNLKIKNCSIKKTKDSIDFYINSRKINTIFFIYRDQRYYCFSLFFRHSLYSFAIDEEKFIFIIKGLERKRKLKCLLKN